MFFPDFLKFDFFIISNVVFVTEIFTAQAPGNVSGLFTTATGVLYLDDRAVTTSASLPCWTPCTGATGVTCRHLSPEIVYHSKSSSSYCSPSPPHVVSTPPATTDYMGEFRLPPSSRVEQTCSTGNLVKLLESSLNAGVPRSSLKVALCSNPSSKATHK